MLTDTNERWLAEFTTTHGRPPRVLHIGNIANNAYLNARFLQERGIDGDVVCYDYYHIMGCPEWEEGEFASAQALDHFAPDWATSGVAGFERPRWFVQGPQDLCLQYLLARCTGEASLAEGLWQQLREANRTAPGPRGRARGASAWVRARRRVARYHQALISVPDPAELFRVRVRARLKGLGSAAATAGVLAEPAVAAAGLSARAYRRILQGYRRAVGAESLQRGSFAARIDALCADFDRLFAPRRTVFRDALGGYASLLGQWQELFGHYDVVVGYATDGIYPLLAGKRPYVAYEHGTIRSIPFQDDVQGQLCALTYRLADGVAITNADNIAAAARLGLTQHRFVPHPINDTVARDEAGAAYRKLHADMDSDFIVFHPSRQHWEERRHPDWEKGNDFFLRGFAAFVHQVDPRASAVLVNWGTCVQASRELIAALGIEARVRWIEPLPHRAMMRMIESCDALADQFFLGAFGSTMPKALSCGRPALMYLDVEKHRWCFPEPPPVANVRTPEQVHAALERMYRDPDHYRALCAQGRAWYERWHSSDVVANALCDIFREAL